jgi:hypothetical protein
MTLTQARAAYVSWQRTVWACLQAPACPPRVLNRALERLDQARWRLVALETRS